MSSLRDFGLAEPITRARADEKYIVPTPIQKRPFSIAINGAGRVAIDQLDTVVVALPIFHQAAIHGVHEPIDRVVVFTRPKPGGASSPLTFGRAAEANYSYTPQNQYVLAASCVGQVSIGVAKDVAVHGKEVGGIGHDVNCDLLDGGQATCRAKGAPRARASDEPISRCGPDEMARLKGIEKRIGISVSRRITEQFVRHNIRARTPSPYGRSEPVGSPLHAARVYDRCAPSRRRCQPVARAGDEIDHRH